MKAVSPTPVTAILVNPTHNSRSREARRAVEPRWWVRRDGGLGLLREPGAVARQERIVAGGKLRLIDPNVASLRRGACFRCVTLNRN